MKQKISLLLKNMLFILLIALLFFPCLLTAQITGKDITVGKAIQLHSNVLNEDRNIYVYTPVDHNTSQHRYPVLYVLDGNGSFFFSLAIANFLSRNSRMPQSIVIGIPNTNRMRDFTPTVDEQTPGSGGADKFLEFLEDELIPYIDQHYKTHPFRILYGHSLCGMFSIYTLFTRPDLFKAHIAVSPYLQYDNEYVIKKVKSILEKKSVFDNYLYITVGDEPDYLTSLNKFITLLENNAEKLQWLCYQKENEDHGSVPLKSVYDGLEFIHSDWLLPNDVALQGIESIKKYYAGLHQKYGNVIEISEVFLNTLGYQFMQHGFLEKAIDVFKYNVELYPNSANVYDSLGEGFETNNQFKLALKNYHKAVELGEKTSNPNTKIYQEHIERIQEKINN